MTGSTAQGGSRAVARGGWCVMSPDSHHPSRLPLPQHRPQLAAGLRHGQEFTIRRQHDAPRAAGEVPPQVECGGFPERGDLVGVDHRHLAVRPMHLKQVDRRKQDQR